MSAQSTIQINEEYIRLLRQENELLRIKLAEAKAGDEVIRRAFQNRGSEMGAFRGMSAKDAIEKLDRMVLSKKTRLSAMKHTTQTYQQCLDELKMECNLLRPEGSWGAASSDVWAREEEDAMMKLRALENSLEKTELKLRKAEIIGAHYLKLKKHLQDESLTYHSQLDSLETELKHRKVLHSVELMKNEAQLSKEAAEFYDRLEEKLLESNTRVKFLQESFDDEDESEEDEPDVLSREALKHQSQQIISANVTKAWK